ncbi:FecR family protein [Tenacibaculum maritimum]|uniref:Uncharacterized protein n=1 Tax=Tenacibaculum maritimum NCIMB 2154 TaxID=1349785 RepID=A0A2H1ED80_9FLAO|nr:FecR domain-containing protein [Tenacibaculum maritimum]SFZ85002.1 Probable transmembrane protein of unknown function; putative anti ECF-type sigma factor [Tenacibaculum maritimum NCIMB 2154]
MADIDKIIAKHFTEKFSEEEELQFLAWKKESEIEYKKLSYVWKHTQMKNHTEKFDIDEGWNSLKKKLFNKEIPVKNSRKKMWLVAASISILLTLALPFIWNQETIKTVTASAITKVTLSDGSVVTLNKGACLSYPLEFKDKKCSLTLEGEAFFEVESDPDKPFEVKVGGTRVVVLGTSFNIKSELSSVEVIVKSGQVSFSSGEDKSVLLTAGNKGIFKEAGISKKENEDVNFLSWKTRKIKFENKSLSFILSELERIYSTPIATKGDNSKCFATINFEEQSLEEIIKELQLLFDFEVGTNAKGIVINGSNCSRK